MAKETTPKAKPIKPWVLLFAIAWLIPLVSVMRPIIGGWIPFWYDPARDMLMAWDNLGKPTLIGPPTGIPGFFYGPYWIWFLSLGQLVSRDPRIVTFIVLTLPYFFIFPYLLYSLSRLLANKILAVILWLAFITAFPAYSGQIWNPNLSPLIFLAIIYASVNADFRRKPWSIAFLGALTALLLNFNFSLGAGVLLGETVFVIISLFGLFFSRKEKLPAGKAIADFLFFATGGIFVFLPFFLFEMRHGFNQIKSMVYTLSQAVLHNSVVVGQTGLNKTQIIDNFVNRLAAPWHMPVWLYFLLFSIVIFYFLLTRQIKFASSGKKLFAVLLLNSAAILCVLLTSKNPVWGYHFIGVEVIGLLLPAVILIKKRILINAAAVWTIALLLIAATSFFKPQTSRGYVNSDLNPKKETVERIYKDARNESFGVAALNPAIYTYDYDYLFRWLSRGYGRSPAADFRSAKFVYLIIPMDAVKDSPGFVENRTPSANYKTAGEWRAKDGSLVIKRERL